MTMKVLIVALLAVQCAFAMRRYDGDKVFHLFPEDENQLQILAQFLNAPGDQYDFWREPSAVGKQVDLHVSAKFVQFFTGLVQANNIPYTIVVDDVQKLIEDVDAANAHDAAKHRDASSRIVGTFATIDDLNAWLTTMCAEYPALAKCGTAGSTFEGRTINYIKIGASSTAAKKKIFLEGTIHAREWLATATIVYLVNKMLTTYGSDPTVKQMVDDYEWIVIPVANPDGYVYTHTTDRLWRKTRSKSSPNAKCVGADPNRNWDHLWSSAGTSTNPCADTYHGSKVFSEIETSSLSQFITDNKANALAYFAVHAYSQYWLIPYGAGPKPTDFTELTRVANIGANALMAVNNKVWSVGNIQEVIYPAAGGSIDWVKDTAGIKYCYAFEVRPGSTAVNGFVVATSEIEPSALEVWAGLVASIGAMIQ